MTQFHLCVTCIGNNTYRVQTQVPHIPLAEAVVEWNVEDWLIHVAQIRNMAILGDRHNLYSDLVALGKQLYAALFTESIKDSWIAAQNTAQQEQAVLLLQLKIAANSLASVPWELLYAEECFLVNDPRIALTINRVQAASSDDLEQMHWALLIHELQPEDKNRLTLKSVDEEEWNDKFIEIDDSDAAYAEDSAVVANVFGQIAASPPATPEKEHSPGASVQNHTQMTTHQQVEPPQRTSESVFVALFIGTLTMIIVAAGTLLWGYQPRQIGVSLAPLRLERLNHRNWQAVSTQEITAIAIAQFHQGELSTAQYLVEELLNRKALQNADTALNAVPHAKTDTILFLRGRLAWQSLQVEQARRYWEAAVKQNAEIKYYNALGFAYYAQDNLSQANEAWFQALYLANQSPAPQDDSSNSDLLTTYAGIALVLRQSAQNQLPDDQVRLINKAVKLREKVLAEDSANFQPQQLDNHWLWHQKAVADWRSLLLIKD